MTKNILWNESTKLEKRVTGSDAHETLPRYRIYVQLREMRRTHDRVRTFKTHLSLRSRKERWQFEKAQLRSHTPGLDTVVWASSEDKGHKQAVTSKLFFSETRAAMVKNNTSIIFSQYPFVFSKTL